MSQTDRHNFLERSFFGGIGIILIVLLILFSTSPLGFTLFTAAVTLATLLSLVEFYTITKTKGHQPLIFFGILFSLLLFLYLAFNVTQPFFGYVSILLLLLFSSYLYFFVRGDHPLTNLSITLFGFCYLTIPLSFILLISKTGEARWWLLYLLVVTKMTDIFAYFIGKNWGKRALAPQISPKKTVEGALGGFIFAVGSSILFYFYLQYIASETTLQFTFWQSIGLGSIISILAQIGDLAESVLKRDVGVKDSNTLPGLGGMLDIVDSLIFTSPTLYYFLSFL